MAAYAKTIVAVLIGVLTVIQHVLTTPPTGAAGWVAALAGPLITALGVYALPNASNVAVELTGSSVRLPAAPVTPQVPPTTE